MLQEILQARGKKRLQRPDRTTVCSRQQHYTFIPTSYAAGTISASAAVSRSSAGPIGSGMPTSSSHQSLRSSPSNQESKTNNNLHANEAEEYSLFNDSQGSNQWASLSGGVGGGGSGAQSYYGGLYVTINHGVVGGGHHEGPHHHYQATEVGGGGSLGHGPGGSHGVAGAFMLENEPLHVDASKAPGYRGNAISSPVRFKASSNQTTPPSGSSHLSLQQQQQQQPQCQLIGGHRTRSIGHMQPHMQQQHQQQSQTGPCRQMSIRSSYLHRSRVHRRAGQPYNTSCTLNP